MRKYDVDKRLNDTELVQEKINEFLMKNIITRITSEGEIEGHILKSSHNLEFIQDIGETKFLDRGIIGCYYACYHAALSLIMTKNYSSKNHLAILLILIKEFYKAGLDKKDIEMLSNVLDHEDILFYVDSKNKREDASYSSKTKFDRKTFEKLRLQTQLFAGKIKEILNEKYSL